MLHRIGSALQAVSAYGPGLVPPALGPRRRFVVLGSARCGSRLLMNLLESQSGVFCDYEILNPRNNRISHPFRWVQSHAVRATRRGRTAYGFKVFVHHLRDLPLVDGAEAFVHRLSDAGYLVVALTRRNLLHQTVSLEYAQLVGRHHYKVTDELDERSFALDPVQVILQMSLFEIENDFVRSVSESVRHLDVSYEDDLLDAANHPATVDRIMSALGRSSAGGPVRTYLRRSSTGELRGRVANWDEVADVIGRTRFAKYLID